MVLPVIVIARKFVVLLFAICLVGCSNQGFHIKQLAKTDIDMVSDTVLATTREELKNLLIKLLSLIHI